MDPQFFNLLEIPLPLSFSSTFAAGSSSSGPNHDDPWMDPRIWRKLPTKILDRIIAFLPPPAFFRSRCVCKRWNNLLLTNAFLQLYLTISPQCRHWFLFFKGQSLFNDNKSRAEGYLFDPYDLVWYRLPFPLVPPSGFSPAASSGGLVCWISDNPAPKTLLLSNPLSRTLNQLPPTLSARYQPAIGFSVTPTSIDVTLAGDDLINNCLAVKNSTAERFRVDAYGANSLLFPAWQVTPPLPRLINFESAGRMVHVNGRLYSMSFHPFNVATYDIEAGIWWDIAPPMKRFLKFPIVVESDTGKLLLVSGVEKRSLIVPKSLRIWSLEEGAAWLEMERMPQMLYDVFCPEMEACGNGFHCVGHGEFILFMIPGSVSHMGVMFDMKTKVWKGMPPCPYVGMGELSEGFAYEPRLSTPVTSLLSHQFIAAPFPA